MNEVQTNELEGIIRAVFALYMLWAFAGMIIAHEYCIERTNCFLNGLYWNNVPIEQKARKRINFWMKDFAFGMVFLIPPSLFVFSLVWRIIEKRYGLSCRAVSL